MEAHLKLSCRPGPALLLAGVLLCGAPASRAQAETTSSPGQPIPGTQGGSPFASSVQAKPVPGVLPLSLRDAIDRGLKQNLSALLSTPDLPSARGQLW